MAGPADNIEVVRHLASRVGPVLGSAMACTDIPQSRIQPLVDKFKMVIAQVASSDAEREELTRLFDNSSTDGSDAINAGKVDCQAADRELAELEKNLSEDSTSSDSVATPPNPPTAAPAVPQPAATTPAATTPAMTTPAVSTPAVTTPAVANTTQGVTDSEIRFGIVAPLSGAFEAVGRQMKIGIEAAFNRANDAGGIAGRMLRLVAADDESNPERTLGAMRQLYEKERVFGFIGNVSTPTAAVAVPYALQQRTLFFGAFTGSRLLRNDPPDRYVFNYRASSAEEIQAIVQYLLKTRRVQSRHIAVFSAQDAYGDEDFAAVTKAIRLLGMQEGGVLRLPYNRNSLNVDEAINRLSQQPSSSAKQTHTTPAKQVKAVIMFAPFRIAARFIEKARAANPGMIYATVSSVGSTKLADELVLLGPRYTSDVIVTQVVPPVSGYSSAVLEYKKALAKYFPGEKPAYVSLEAYIAANVLIQALKRIDPPFLDTENVVDTLENMRALDLGLGTELNFGRTEHQASHKIWGSTLDQQGQYQPLDLQ